MTDFFKFPKTPHLCWLGIGLPRDDKFLEPDEAEQFLANWLVAEEKIDGANLGIRVGSGGSGLVVQNRGTVLGPRAHPQFSPLWPWLHSRQQLLVQALGRSLMMFGEWCFAVHSVRYDSLPDWFACFDVYDLDRQAFWSSRRRNALCESLGLVTVPRVAEGNFTQEGLVGLFGRSAFSSSSMEGIYLRVEDEQHLLARAKLVRPEFTQAIEEHWMKKPLEKNRLASG